MSEQIDKPTHFIRQIIEEDLKSGKHKKIVTRFPPEPNGYLHIGHAKSICLNFSLALDYQGTCHLRFDDTNPTKEEMEFVEAIKDDVRWLGFDWGKNLFHASDYYDKLYEFARALIQDGKAYIDSSTPEQIREQRGTLTEPGINSPDRNRPIAESLDLFERMKAGEFEDGKYVLRAKIDMSSGNVNMRDPTLYRIRHATHQMTGDKWCIYPMYDFAHSLSDALEGITHSLCTLEFEDHRPLYDWCVDNTHSPIKPRQIEFSRLNLSHTITSKRKLKQLVDEKHVDGWDDPRMPTLQGVRKRGYPPQAIRKFCEMIGISKVNSVIDMTLLEECVRDELNHSAPRAMCVIDPIKVVITNFPKDHVETLTASLHPNDTSFGMRDIPFTREIFIERDDFMQDPSPDYFRLAPGKEVRLRSSYVIKCEKVITDPKSGDVSELHCTYDPDTLGKKPEGRKVKGVIHWVSATHGKVAKIRLYDRLFTVEDPGADEDFTRLINPNSLTVRENCYIEPALVDAKPEQQYQFLRVGYFVRDAKAADGDIVFSRIVDLKESWQKDS